MPRFRPVRTGLRVRARASSAALAVACGLVLAACGSSGDKADPAPDGGSPSVSATSTSLAPSTTPSAIPTTAPSTPVTTQPAPPPVPDPLGNKSFAKGSCVANDQSATASDDTAFLAQVPCSDATAIAKVVEREPFGATALTSCYDGATNADKLVQLSRPGTGKDAGKPQYALVCLRNLAAPHPGDPGQGGGTNIIKGDCLVEKKSYQLDLTGTGSGTSTVETACAATGSDAPDYRVIAMGYHTIVRGGKDTPCPRSTKVEFTAKDELLMGAVYCAVRV